MSVHIDPGPESAAVASEQAELTRWRAGGGLAGPIRVLPLSVRAAAVSWLVLVVGLILADGAVWGQVLSNLSYVAFPALAAGAFLSRSRTSPQAGERRAWRLLAVSMLTWAIGGAIWTFYGFSRNFVYPFPSLADVGFVGYVVPAAVGLLALPAVRGSLARTATVALEGLAVGLAVFFVSASTVLRSAVGERLHGLTRMALLAYPLGDALMVALVLAITIRITSSTRRSWLLLAAGLTVLAVTDSVYVQLQSTGSYRAGTVFDAGWASAFLLLAVAGSLGSPTHDRHQRLTTTQSLLPYGAFLVAGGTGMVKIRTVLHSPDLIVLAVALLILVAAHQVLTVVEKIRLTSDLGSQREFLSAVVDNLHDAVIACDADGRITFANSATAHLHQDPARARVANWRDDLCGADGTGQMADDDIPLFRALRGLDVVEEPFTVCFPGQEAVAVTASGRALRDATGRTVGAVVAMHRVSERVKLQQILANQASVDELTGLGNRRMLTDLLGRYLAQDRQPVLLLIDLDDFKDINDSLGHDAGDLFLVQAARRITACVPDRADVCRLGGDEFVVVVPDAGPADAIDVAEALLAAISGVTTVAGTEVDITASIGVARQANDHPTVGELLKSADLAMYQAKALGKGAYVLFDQDLQQESLERLSLQNDLRKAIRHGDLTVVYQPIIDLKTGAMSAAEALVRWDHPGRGSVSPATFIPVAEQAGLIDTLGTWVLRAACAQLLAWDAGGGDPLFAVAVNVSTRQLERPGLLTTLDECLAAGVDPSRLTLEVTETALTVNDAVAAATLREVRERGVALAIDDFGTGYSSLARLRTAPVSRLKIDRSFISEIDSAYSHAPIVEATMTMARGLGLGIVAEGVETVGQLEYLRARGCPAAQGFLLSRPVDAAAILALMAGPRPWEATLAGTGAPAATDPSPLSELVRLALSPQASLEDLVRPLLAQLRSSTGLSVTFLARVQADLDEQQFTYVDSLTGGPIQEGSSRPWSTSLSKQALGPGPRLTADAQVVYQGSDLAVELGWHSFAVEPVTGLDGQLYGTLCGASADRVSLTATQRAEMSLIARLISDKLRRRERDSGSERARATQARNQAGARRDDQAVGRDRAAEARDDAAETRDNAAETLEAAPAGNEVAHGCAAEARRAAATDRSLASGDRDDGAADRAGAESDRSAAAKDRRET